MATIINTGGGYSSPTLLASLTNVPTSSTAISGTNNWKNYDAIYFECFMHFKNTSDKSVFTNLILTNTVSIGDRYQPIRVGSTNGEANEVGIHCYFSENALNINKITYTYDVTKLNIYGVNF